MPNKTSQSPSLQAEFARTLKPYQKTIEEVIRANISSLGPKTKLRDACEYALTNGGKRFRPVLVYMISNALGRQADVSQAALAIEYFHTASLIADDLPCMDDDDERRGVPSTHKAFGESTALLASYALIAAGYHCLANAKPPRAEDHGLVCALAVENASYNTGLLGATGGQYLDISPPDLKLQTLRDVIQKKTCSLFEISFVFGWLYGGGSVELLPKVKQAALHFGMAFQIADDLGDVAQDAANGRQINMAGVFGREEALRMFHEEIGHYRRLLGELDLDVPEMRLLAEYLECESEK